MKKLAYAVALAALVVGCSQKATVEAPKKVEVAPDMNVDVKEDINTKLERINNSLGKVYFDFDKYDIRSDMYGVVSNNASLLNQDGKDLNIVVEGNCDEWGSEEYNQALGLKRAKAVKDGLESQGVSSSRITIKSYGENNPVCNDKTKECDAQNRRAETKVQF
ncbi:MULTISPECIES: OmpA family protein [unclassified Campylobacter]|uniref:OmpA family protein n=1 Tax=unclassified Campylobacter TaxID=2593542 RepID=UPI001BDA9017|nr:MULTISPECIES: OmpA family protein [unclassified Campylobacter]MBZ7976286.1 OmpA family protein [Campylobacter sp. RM12637]MBZ7977705.1 OmpA family protein [Campylobacter sp. RM12654]MBZ7979637.1 OmpA family protein [Campylobacter sp. RM12642]MBZ7983710.1 OmpA family protein [Campylobacter sp. RM12647]MBZ7991381.1 OmpA family protein [Campylobacter sp. RM9331]MBZ7992940.1 OmpA family protein [Campylobacter sp. RM9333]MBZ8005450.1 OmpA family protein [Campylobacter sp. RM9332]MBZ8007337.1 